MDENRISLWKTVPICSRKAVRSKSTLGLIWRGFRHKVPLELIWYNGSRNGPLRAHTPRKFLEDVLSARLLPVGALMSILWWLWLCPSVTAEVYISLPGILVRVYSSWWDQLRFGKVYAKSSFCCGFIHLWHQYHQFIDIRHRLYFTRVKYPKNFIHHYHQEHLRDGAPLGRTSTHSSD